MDTSCELLRQRMLDIVDALEAYGVDNNLMTAASMLTLACRFALDLMPDDTLPNDTVRLFQEWGAMVVNFPSGKERLH